MTKKLKQTAFILFLAGIVITGFSACYTQTRQEPPEQAFDIERIASYREIPGVTDEEIEAIEALKTSRAAFSYGSMPSTEAFKLRDGSYAGFAALFCDLLSELFGVPFVQELHAWNVLKDGIDAKTIDFTGELTPTPERLLDYYMSHPVAERGVGVFTRDGFAKTDLVDNFKGLKTGFYKGTITAESILAVYPQIYFDIVDVYDEKDVNEKLSAGVIDVFIADETEALTYSGNFSYHKNVFPLIHTPVSLTTANPELTPVISVVNKYIIAGGIDRLTDFYKEGRREYANFSFIDSLTDTETAYLNNLSANGAKVSVAFENDNYPICFYNEKENEFQGIAPEILAEIASMTGIAFENVAERDEAWAAILEKLSSGEAAMVSELLFTQERKDMFLWTETPYAVNRYALISKSEYPYLEAYQVVRAAVGVFKSSAREDIYRELFPNNDNLKYFDYQSEAFEALERGEVDLVVSTEYEFLTLTNYLEKPGYKINIVLNAAPAESLFGFNKGQEILRTLIGKAVEHVDTARIENEWVNRTFNYERLLADERSHHANQRSAVLAVSVGILLLMLITVSILLTRNKRKQETIENQMAVISAIYNTLPDIVFTKDTNGAYTSFNRSFEKFTGRSAAELAGKTPLEIFTGDENMARSLMASDRKVIDENLVKKFENRVTFHDGAVGVLDVIKTPLVKNGRVVGLLGIARDITKHTKLLEKTIYLSEYELMKYTLTSNALGIGLWDMDVVDGDPLNPGNRFIWSSEFRQMLGFSDETDFPNVFGSLLDRIHPDDKDWTMKAFAAHIIDRSGSTPFDIEYRIMMKNGTYGFFRAFGATQRDDAGVPLRVAGALEDITERKHMQMRIEKRDLLLHTVNEVASILFQSENEEFENDLWNCMGMLGKAVGADRVQFWKNNERDGKLFGTQIIEWLSNAKSQKNKEYTVDILYDERVPGWTEVLSQGKCINSLVRDLSPREQEQLGIQNILSIFVSPILVNDKYWGFIGFDNCHSEQLLSEIEQTILHSGGIIIANALMRNDMTRDIRAAAAQLEVVVNNYPGILWSVDKDYRVSQFNGYYLKYLGLSPEDVIGKTLEELESDPIHKDSLPYIYKALSERRKMEWTAVKGNRVFHERAVPAYDENGNMLNLLGSLDDITDIVRLQKELEDAMKRANDANTAKSSFLARMSHEIRTPMNAIIGMTELALREKNLEAARKRLFTVKQAGKNLLAIINDILDFSKIEQDKLQIMPENYSVASLLNDVISIIMMKVNDSQVRFAVNIDCNIPNALIGDETRIRQVLINILSNAVKYTDRGYVSFTVCREIIDDGAVNLIIEVKDSGRGIKQEDIGSIFNDYAQSDIEKNKDIEGAGLGLAITNSLVKAMGGSIKVQSEYGVGSVFTVKLPQKIHSSDKLASVNDPGKMSVLVFERRDIYVNSIADTMKNLGVSCAVAQNDSEFYEKMTSGSYSFVFLSFEMLERNRDTINTYGTNSKIVLLAEFGESIHDGNWSVIAMPLHALSVANVLNDLPNSFSYNTSTEPNVSFTAPGARVLVVDDINTNLNVAEGLLLPYKMNIDLRKSGIEAIEAVQSGHYDIVFMDHRMPEMDGVEATRRIRDLGGYCADVPIIALTANAVTGMKEMFLENGFNDYVSKPIDTVKLNAVLEKYIHKEKHKSPAYEKAAGIPAKNLNAGMDLQIYGVDVKRGALQSGGTIPLYLKTLAVFCEDGYERMTEIRKCIETGNFSLYTTHVHAMKSAAANIGAFELSEAAKGLELAGTGGDIGYIKAHNENFLMDLERLIGGINMALLSQNRHENDENSANTQMVIAELEKLKAALNIMDAGAMNSAVDNLQELTRTGYANSDIKNIYKYIMMAEYNEAEALVDSLIRDMEVQL